jgi:hypothetical protein
LKGNVVGDVYKLEMLGQQADEVIRKIMKLKEKIIKTLNENGWTVSQGPEKLDNEYYIEISHGTPTGWKRVECIRFNGTNAGFVQAVTERFDTFDVDEEVEAWIGNLGKNGDPDSFRALVKNEEYIENVLRETSQALAKLCRRRNFR